MFLCQTCHEQKIPFCISSFESTIIQMILEDSNVLEFPSTLIVEFAGHNGSGLEFRSTLVLVESGASRSVPVRLSSASFKGRPKEYVAHHSKTVDR